MDLSTVLDFLYGVVIYIFSLWEVRLIAGHTVLNFALAVSVAIATTQFRLDKLVDVFVRKLLPLVIVYATARLVGAALAGAPPAAGFAALMQAVGVILPVAALLAIEALLFSNMIDNLAKVPGLEGVVGSLPAPIANMFIRPETQAAVSIRTGIRKARSAPHIY